MSENKPPKEVTEPPECSIEDCDRKHYGRGWCSLHYGRWMRNGDPEKVRAATENRSPGFYATKAVAAFKDKVFVNKLLANTEVSLDGCLRWKGYVSPSGYGMVHLPKFGARRIHRVVWENFVGEIPDGMTLDHLCHTRNCLNRHHLRLATSRDNTLNSETSPIAINARKTHCVNGHEFTEANTTRYMRGNHMRRECRTCKKQARIARQKK